MSKKSSLIEDLIDLAARLPVWVSCLLALLSYVLFHNLSQIQIDTANIGPGEMGTFAVKKLYSTLALFLQVIIPFAFLMGGLVSFIKGRKRKGLHRRVSKEINRRNEIERHSILSELDWKEFEILIAETFRLKGYKIQENNKPGPDGGIDILLFKNNKKYIAQCKHWKKFKVGVDIVREQFGIMLDVGAVGAFIVTSGKFTDQALKFAENKNITLIEGSMLENSLRKAKNSIQEQEQEKILCPKCGAEMIIRKAKKGVWAGHFFWGCSKFPNCNGLKPIEQQGID